MEKTATESYKWVLFVILIIGIGSYSYSFFTANTGSGSSASIDNSVPAQESRELSKEQAKKARYDYFFKLLRDPRTNSIPDNIRSRELNHARSMPTFREVNRRLKAQNPSFRPAQDFNWQLAGPTGVGGRTRALGIDQRNPDIIIAGGVSGGIWRSTNGGDSWTHRTPDAENFSVSSLVQDPLNPDTWYYASGELISSSANAPGAPYSGTGIFRSTDNGMTWSRIPGTEDDDTRFDSQFDYVNRITVSPTTGTVFIASNGLGVFRSADGDTYNDLTLGGGGDHLFADVTVAGDGTLAAVLSSVDAGNASNNPGIFISGDDGQTWSEITPTNFPTDHARSVITFAPSDPNIIYVLTQKENDSSNQGVSFFRIDLSGNPANAQDRAGNLPNFDDGPVGGMDLQTGYNMTVKVKPDDPNFVLVGGINLFRSTNGFTTGQVSNTDIEKDQFWVGGYAKENNLDAYPGQHPDQHEIIFDPTNSNLVWVGHDGGVSVSNNITSSSVSWTDKNNGYIVTQFYDVSIPENSADDRLMGGTQDNGTPLFEFDGQQNETIASLDVSFADGGYSFFTNSYIFVSNQRNQVRNNNRIIQYQNINPFTSAGFRIVQPAGVTTDLFINPYEIDSQNENTMYYPAQNELWRNTGLDEITNQDNNGTTTNWSEVAAAQLPDSYVISALKSTNKPANSLYFAGSDVSETPGPPIIKRLDNASVTDSEPVDISVPGAPDGAFVHDIAINPADGSEALVVMSNYNIVGLYHTDDAGNNWQAIEGDLTGDNAEDSPNPGPSLRSATIIPAESGSVYMVATSTGIYATQMLDGQSTNWGREAENLIGASVIENISSRFSNGDVAVGSHGRGIFLGSFQGTIDFNAPDNSSISPNFPNPFSSSTDTSIPINLANRSAVTVNIYNITGRKVMQPVLDRIFQPGEDTIPINFNSTYASGIYLYQVIAEPVGEGKKFVGTGKMTFIN